MALPDAAAAYYLDQQRVSASTVALARRYWAQLGYGDFDQAWRTLGPQLLTIVSAGQQAAVGQALAYVPTVLDELNIDSTPVAEVAPRSLVGVASDGRPLDSLLYQTVVQTRTALGQGQSLVASLQSGGALLDQIVATQVVDAGRAAESVATVIRPAVTGYVRMLNTPSCGRCAILAGRHYRWNAGFLRHPFCDCRHIPATEDVSGDFRTDPRAAIELGHVTGLSKADTQAIFDGADPAKVVNAHRGMSAEQIAGQRLKVTTEGTGRRRGRSVRPTRLRPEAVYQLAKGDRDEAIRLLRAHGYIVDTPEVVAASRAAIAKRAAAKLAAENAVKVAAARIRAASEDDLAQMLDDAYNADDSAQADALEAELDRRARNAHAAELRRIRVENAKNAESRRISALIEQGMDSFDAVHEVTGVPVRTLKRAETLRQLRSEGLVGETFDELASRSFAMDVERRHVEAEDWTRGTMLSHKGEQRVADTRNLFTKGEKFARANASPELLEWFDRNGFYSLTEYKEMLIEGRGLSIKEDFLK